MCDKTIKIALAQFDNTPSNTHKTISKVEKILEKASQKEVDFVVFPELFLTGYDLPWIMKNPQNCIFEMEDNHIFLLRMLAKQNNISYLIGLPLRINSKVCISALYINSNGEIENIISKNYLYGSEDNFFEPGTQAETIHIQGFCIGLGICFDSAHSQYIESLKSKGMDIFIGSSLYGKGEGKIEMISNYSQISSNYNILSAVANYAQKTGEWISCGNSSFYDINGRIYKNLKDGEEGLLISQIRKEGEICKYI